MTLDATGLTIKTAAEIEAEIIAAIKDPAVMPAAQIGPESPLGQTISIIAAQLGACYQVQQQVYEAADPDDAADEQLDSACALGRITRQGASKSTVTLRFTGTNGTAVGVGTIARIPDGARFITTAGGTVSFGRVDLAAEAEDFGPVVALAGTITEAVTVIAGISAVTHISDAVVGRLVESDQALRQRREASLAVNGSATDAAIAARCLESDGVTQCIVISNRTSVTDAYGIPARAARVVVYPTSLTTTRRAALRAVIWAHTPAGIELDGATSGTIVDSQGVTQTIKFQYATEVAVHVEIVVTTDPTTYGGDAAVSAAVLAATASPTLGGALLLWRLENAVTDAVTGILTIEARALRGSTPTSGDIANISADLDEILLVDSGDITVTSS